MSRIGKKPITLPQGVKINCKDGKVLVEGKKGKLETLILKPIQIKVDKDNITMERPSDEQHCKMKQGTMRSLVQCMIHGVNEGYHKTLIIEGVGFKASMKGKDLVMNLGFSHPIELTIPEGLNVKVKTPTEILIEGYSKQLVGSFAANIRSLYEPEPYKGKGVRYLNEVVRRKAGKTVAK